MQEKKFDLEDRLVDYVCRMIDVVEALPSQGEIKGMKDFEVKTKEKDINE